MRKKLLIAVLVAGAACVAVFSPLRKPAQAQGNMALTAMDYIEIQQLVNKLGFALDYCIDGGQAFADLFVDGGGYIVDDGSGNLLQFNTRDQLIRTAAGPDCESRVTPPSSYILHLTESLVIEPTPDGARGTSYAIYPSRAGKYRSEDVAGQLGLYHDEYVKTRDGWRFKTRRHETMPVVGEVSF